MKKLRYVLIFIILLAFCGCDSNLLDSLADDSSEAATIEAAQIALNDGNYDEVISLIGDDYDPSAPDSQVARILASAYMGKAGIDLTYLIENADSTDGDSFDAIAAALSIEATSQAQASSFVQASPEALASTDPTYITFTSIEDLLANLETAQDILETLVDYYTDGNLTPQNDDVVQLGMASALHFIMKIGHCAGEVVVSNVPINKYAYRELFPLDDDWVSLLDDLAAYVDSDQEIITSLIADLRNVSSAVSVLIATIGGDEDITDEFNDFLRELLGLDEGADETALSAAIAGYSGSSISDFISNSLLAYN
jgi:hypothetical protein